MENCHIKFVVLDEILTKPNKINLESQLFYAQKGQTCIEVGLSECNIVKTGARPFENLFRLSIYATKIYSPKIRDMFRS